MGSRLPPLWDAVLGNVSQSLALACYAIPSPLSLQVVAFVSAVLQVLFFAVQQPPVLTFCFWDGLQAVINATQIVSLSLDLAPVHLTPPELRALSLLHGAFDQLAPRKVARVLRAARWASAGAGETLVLSAGPRASELVFVFSGALDVALPDRDGTQHVAAGQASVHGRTWGEFKDAWWMVERVHGEGSRRFTLGSEREKGKKRHSAWSLCTGRARDDPPKEERDRGKERRSATERATDAASPCVSLAGDDELFGESALAHAYLSDRRTVSAAAPEKDVAAEAVADARRGVEFVAWPLATLAELLRGDDAMLDAFRAALARDLAGKLSHRAVDGGADAAAPASGAMGAKGFVRLGSGPRRRSSLREVRRVCRRRYRRPTRAPRAFCTLDRYRRAE